MSKSKARKLAEFLRNLNDNSKLDTTGFADNRFVTSRSSLESNKTSDNTFVTNKAVTEYIDNAIEDFVVDTTDFTLTFDGHMTGTATVTDFGNTTVSLSAHSSLNTGHIAEHTNYPYFTNARARAAISVSGNALSYNSSTGVITANYEESPVFTGDLEIRKDDPKITLFNNSAANTDPNGTIAFSEVSGYTNFDINYNGASDRLEFRGLIGSTLTDLVYFNRSTGTTVNVFGGLTATGVLTASGGNSGNWNTAYGWGNHSTQNYATTTGDTFTGSTNFNSSVYLNDWVYVDVAGYNFVLRSDTNNRNTIEWQQGTTRRWTLDLQPDGDLNFVPSDTADKLRISNEEIATQSYVTSRGYITSSANITGTSAGLSGSPNITVGTISSGAITSSSQLTINSTGSSNAIVAKTGSLINFQVETYATQTTLRTDSTDFYIWQPNSGYQFRATNNGAVYLSYDGNTKLTTSNTGVSITGALTATSYSGSLVSSVTATTQSASDNSTKVATTAYVDSAVSGIVDSAPGTLNTLNELAAALGDDANFSTTVTNSIATKLPLAGGTMTGTIDSHVGDSGVILKSGNSSASGTPDQFKINHNLGNVEIRNSRGSINFPTVVNFTNINDINVNGTINLGSSATANHFTGHYYHNRYSNNNVYVHFYPNGNTTNSNTYLRMPNGSSFRALAFEGAVMSWPGTFSIGTVNSSGSYTVPNSSQNGLKSANGNNFFLPLDQYNNMHIRSTTGSEYHDSTAYYFRRVNQTEIFRINTNGVDIRSGTLAINGTTVINASRDVTNVASVYASANIGNLDATNGIGQQMEKGDASVTTLRFDSNRYRIYAGQSAGEMITALETGNVGIGDTNPSEKLTVNGNFQHKGLEMSAGTGVDQLYSATQSLTVGTSWMDTGINGNELASGTYIVQLFVNNHSVGGEHYSEYYSGVMSWQGGNVNSTVSDELVLHRAGHAPNNGILYLRVLRTASADTDDLKLQIRSNVSTTGNSNYVFKFRRMI